MNPIICVVGPTASGKSALALSLCQHGQGEVLSCDSMQLYRQLDIGTAKPSAAEMAGVPHHLIDCIDPTESFSAARYVAMADPILQDILARGKRAVVTGGTGLYVDALIQGRSFAPLPETGKRQLLQQRAAQEGIEPLLQLLQKVDPQAAQRLHPRDEKRIIRALEVYLETGKTITQHNEETRAQPPKYHPLWLGLNYRDRRVLYEQIDRRVDRMVEAGLFDEVARLTQMGLDERCTAMQAIGYKEPLRALRGQCSVQEAIAQIKQESRRYAKRQLTWFRRNAQIHWLILDAPEDFPRIAAQARALIAQS